MFDKNDDGTIDLSELATLFRLLGQNPTQQEVMTMMEAVDRDGRWRSVCTKVLNHSRTA